MFKFESYASAATTIILVILIVIGTAVTAFAEEPNCNSHDNAVSFLGREFGETPRWRGLIADGSAVIEAWLNEETGSWTLTATNAANLTCVISQGMYGELLEAAEIPAKGDPT